MYYTTVIFDFFDVLWPDDYKAWLARHGYAAQGAFKDASERQDRGEIDVAGFIELLSQHSGMSVAEIRAEFGRDSSVDEGVLAILKGLKVHQYKVGLLSNAPSSHLRNILERNDLSQYFDAIAISSEIGHIKPNPEIFHHILGELDSQPAEAIFIDDNMHNVLGAEQVGLQGILFTSAMDLRHELSVLNVRM